MKGFNLLRKRKKREREKDNMILFGEKGDKKSNDIVYVK